LGEVSKKGAIGVRGNILGAYRKFRSKRLSQFEEKKESEPVSMPKGDACKRKVDGGPRGRAGWFQKPEVSCAWAKEVQSRRKKGNNRRPSLESTNKSQH